MLICLEADMVRRCVGAGIITYVSLISFRRFVLPKPLIRLLTFELKDGPSPLGIMVWDQ